MTNIQKPLAMEQNQSFLHNKSGNGLINCLKASNNTIADLSLVQVGDSTLLLGRRIHLRHRIGSRRATGSQIEAGIRGKHHPGLNSIFPFSSLLRDVISLAGDLIFWQSTGEQTDTPTAHRLLSRTVVAQTCFICCQSVQSHIDLHAPAWLKPRSTLSAFHP